MALRVKDIATDPLADLAEAEAPVIRAPLANPIAAAAAPMETAAETPAPASGLHGSIIDGVRADLGGGVLAQVPPDLVIHGTAGNDYLAGGAGNDVMRGLAGDDFITGGAGNDSISGDAGNDMIFGGDGNDQINGNDGDDLLRGNAGNDSLWGSAGNDIIEGSEGDDRLEGGDGVDSLFGGSGNDLLRGGDHDDVLDGGDGRDRLEGGKGVDTLTGGTGIDTFVADLSGDTWNNHHYRPDVITDFNTSIGWNHDVLDLRTILDKTLFAGTTAQQAADQGFLSLQEYSFDDGAGGTTFGTYVRIDYNGNEPDAHGMGSLRVFDLQGVHADQLSFAASAGQFLV